MKKNRKKQQRSKASRKRRNACRKTARRPKTEVITASSISDADQINEQLHSYRACDLGSASEVGLMALSLASYIKSVRDRLLSNEAVKPNIFVQFGYSRNSVQEFPVKRELHGCGGMNISLAELVFGSPEELWGMVQAIEGSVREIVSRMNEVEEETIKTVHLRVDETHTEQDPASSFSVPMELIDQGKRIEQTISY